MPKSPPPMTGRKLQPPRTSTGGRGRTPPRVPEQPPELPVMGWLFGLACGSLLSLAAIGWLHGATHNSRAFLPSVRAMAAYDTALGLKRLKAFEANFEADGFREGPAMLQAPPLIRLSGAVGLRDETELIDAMDTFSRRFDEWIQSDQGSLQLRRTPSGVHYPLMGDVRFSWGVRTACVREDFDEAIRLAEEGLAASEAFWKEIGGVPADMSTRILGNRITAGPLRVMERDLRCILAWALARRGDYPQALVEIDRITNEPLEYRQRENDPQAEFLLLRAAIEHQLGDRMKAAASYAEARRIYETPVESSAGGPTTLPQMFWHWPTRPDQVAGSWQAYREHSFGLSHWWTKSRTQPTRPWSFRDNPRDLVDDFLDTVAEENLTGT